MFDRKIIEKQTIGGKREILTTPFGPFSSLYYNTPQSFDPVVSSERLPTTSVFSWIPPSGSVFFSRVQSKPLFIILSIGPS